ncbi:hypothetical protein FD04_GL000502 [Secundilactobacillus odoratitofui DSM 19909 = JCM 15043]|uniref:Uncharacterized protein n=1 Tax=Secundilactobacillus odoratitofui DSM 19909 = JCM 15043 TaxID=1423776 RepID=A0A0R1M2I6_9LACO|nr:hypothetical protein FD04_GL000502 [Secundilactobacillus odoratitofui DSM 19909 = JCM 15043]
MVYSSIHWQARLFLILEGIYVNNQEPQSRMQRYNFNTDNNPSPNRKRPKKPHRIRQILISFFVTLVLIIGVGVWLANRSTKVENGTESTEQTVKDSSSSDSNNSDSSSDSESDSTDSDTTSSNDDQQSGATYGDSGITQSQRSSLQSSINQESDATVKNSEQKKLDDTKSKSSTNTSSSSANTTSNSSDSSSKETDNSNNSDSITFSQSHSFSSVSDAKSWAQATKSQWLKDGYSTYTITSDAQGNYVLKFVK